MDKLKKFAKGIKPIFLFGVILLVILEFTKLRKEISFEEVSNIFYEISIIKIFAMAVLGFVAFLPMIFYDILLNNFLKLDRDKEYIIKRSITVNSFNNLIGFGGVINIGLRMRYFGEEKDSKNFLKFLVKSLFFDIAGLSF
ncbi:MAG: lysylphosphatidylglycerol synthetase family protein, partial [Peptoniphilus sp.]|nr:lysylphosphatidylglycerol synthetase family protein [Peptoniphilus sp.]MDD7352695.1 lysylphosphatidylglycerol synthetase family protein [Peptoniphilaceae bacterium]